MKMLVTGRDGQVARSLREQASRTPHVELVACGRPELDLADPASVVRAITDARPDIVVSAAAYTAVDQAEDDAELAMAVNRDGAGAVAEAAAGLSIPIIHLSTDYVFAGTGAAPHTEDEPTAPIGVYGRSKLEGERAVANANGRHIILRTAWVYSPFGRNFVKTMLRLAQDRDTLAVVEDQWGNPTSALDIADGILHVAETVLGGRSARWGTYHLAGTGATNWSGFARHVLDTSRSHKGPWAAVKGIATADYPTKARRPLNSRLDTGKLESCFGWSAPGWEKSSAACVERILQEGVQP